HYAVGQRLALDVRHGEEDEIHPLIYGVDRDDVRMAELRRGAGLAQKPLAERWVCGKLGWQHLDRHRAVEPHLVSEINDPHPSAAQLTFERVPARKGGLQSEEESVRPSEHRVAPPPVGHGFSAKHTAWAPAGPERPQVPHASGVRLVSSKLERVAAV